MAANQARMRAPPYPRPVSPVDADEIPVCPGTIVYGKYSDEVGEEAAKRATKRRKRIRENAEAYLRGEPIYIMTASLKGPFDRGWKNTWKKKRTANTATAACEVPETTAQSRHARLILQATIPESAAPRRRVDERTDLVTAVDDIEFTQPPVVQQKAPTNVFQKTYNVPDLNRAHLTPTSARRIQDWLRTNDAYKSDRLLDIRSSPTPAHREDCLLTPDTSVRRPVSAGGDHCDTQLAAWADQFRSWQDLEQVPSQQDAPEPSTQQTHESQHRAEAAILAQKTRSVHRIPPSTNLPAFEYKRATKLVAEPRSPVKEPVREKDSMPIVAEEGREVLKPPRKAPNTDLEPPQTAPPGKPALSTETSKDTTINHLPSAQVVSAIVALDGLSNVQSTVDLLLPVNAPTQQATQKQDQVSEGVQCALFEEAASDPKDSAQYKAQPKNNGAKARTAILKDQTPACNHIDTQALLGSIKPFDISTIRNIDITPMSADTPVTASKVPAKKKATLRSSKAKQTSFAKDPASDERQSSIKRGFQVRKQPASTNVPTGTKETRSEDEDGADGDLDPPTPYPQPNKLAHPIDISHKPASFPVVNKPNPTSVPAPRKSILKTCSQPALPACPSSAPPGTTQIATGISISGHAITNGTYQSTTGSQKQDAQPRPVDELDMFAIENGSGGRAGGGDDGLELEQFDMDAVIEDLGSYLGGSWDVERAAAQAG